MWLGPGLAAIVVQCLIILCFHHLKQRNVPLHVPPSPVYPALHAHANDPTVLLQTASDITAMGVGRTLVYI